VIEQTFDFSSNKREKGMKTLKVLGFSITALAASVGSNAVVAEELDFSPGFYVVATAGNTEIDYGSGSKLGGNGYSIGAGYDFNEYLAVEAEFNNYFDFQVGSLNYTITGTSVRGLVRYPLGAWAPFVGYTYASAKETLVVDGTTYSGAGSLSGVSVGLEVALTDTLALRVISDNLETSGVTTGTTSKIGIVSRF